MTALVASLPEIQVTEPKDEEERDLRGQETKTRPTRL